MAFSIHWGMEKESKDILQDTTVNHPGYGLKGRRQEEKQKRGVGVGSGGYSDSQSSEKTKLLAEKCVLNLLDIYKKLKHIGSEKRYCLPCGLVLLILELISGKHPQG